jgi:hypothetical protein
VPVPPYVAVHTRGRLQESGCVCVPVPPSLAVHTHVLVLTVRMCCRALHMRGNMQSPRHYPPPSALIPPQLFPKSMTCGFECAARPLLALLQLAACAGDIGSHELEGVRATNGSSFIDVHTRCDE